ncbi:MAG: hydroxyphenylacetyl-CoA thioesterase PaaI [Acidobacteriota bacterium]
MAEPAPADPQQLAEAVGRAMYARDHASQMLGIALDSIAPDRAQMTMHVRRDMCNGHGICHGGLTFALADSTFAYACNSHNANAVALGCTIDFVAAARYGDTLTAVGEMRQQGSRIGLYDITVTNQDGQTVAVFRGKSYRVKGDVLSGLCEQ